MKKQDVEELENWLKALKEANTAIRNGLGPAHNSNKTFVAIPGIIEYDGYFGTDVYYAVVVEKDENGARPVDWYSWASNANSKHDFVSGFGGWYKYDGYEFIKANSWVENELPNLTKKTPLYF